MVGKISSKVQQVLDISTRLTSISAERQQLLTELELLIGSKTKKVSIPVAVAKKKTKKPDGLSIPQIEALALKIVTKNPFLTTNSLAKKMDVGYYRLQRILEGMESNGIIHRTDAKIMGRAVKGWSPALRNGKSKRNGRSQART